MRKILYLVTKDPGDFFSRLLGQLPTGDYEKSAILLHGVAVPDIPIERVYALIDDAGARSMTQHIPTISYTDMLRMIFEADSVVAL